MRDLVVGWHEGRWIVARKGETNRPFSSRRRAVLAALRLARRIRAAGFHSQEVLIQSRHGDFETVWPVDRDPRGSWILDDTPFGA